MGTVVAGIGNAIMDALVVADDAEGLVEELGVPRGTMTSVDHDTWELARARVADLGVALESGGSCANTISTLGRLGTAVRYCGIVGDDELGRMYAQRMTDSCGGHALRVSTGGPTGKCLSIISRRDAERTMLTDLGISTQLSDLGDFRDIIAQAAVTHFTGYSLLGDPMRSTVLGAMKLAKDSGKLVSLDVADPFVVTLIQDLLWDTIHTLADIVFLNEHEATALVQRPPEEAAEIIAKEAKVGTVVVKLGSRGSMVAHDGSVWQIEPRRVLAVDTTGAGDAYAGGFLHGVVNGWDPESCGMLGSTIAAETVSQLGAVVRDNARLHELLKAVH